VRGVEQGAGDAQQRRRASRTSRSGDREAGARERQIDGPRRELVTSDAHQHLQRCGGGPLEQPGIRRRVRDRWRAGARHTACCGQQLQDVVVGDPRGQHVDAEGPQRRRNRAACPAPAQLSEHGRLAAAAGVGAEQRHLKLDAALGPEAATVRHLLRNGARRQSSQHVVAAVGQPQAQRVLHQGRELAHEHGPVTGDHHPEPHGGTFTEQAEHGFGQASVVHLVEGAQEPLPAVEQQHQVRQSLRWPALPALLGHVGVRVVGQQLLATCELGEQPGQQPVGPLDLCPGHDGPAVRQVGQRQQGAGAAVQGVQVHVSGVTGRRDGARERAQHRGASRSRGACDQQVTPVLEVQHRRPLRLQGRQILDAVRNRWHAARRARAGEGVIGRPFSR